MKRLAALFLLSFTLTLFGQNTPRTVLTVTNLADMLALPTNDVRMVVTLKDSNRGGTFEYVPGDTTATNLGTVYGFGTGRLKRQFSGPLDVRWFGAVSDGTDVTDQMQDAFNAATNIGAVYLPSGTYVVSSTLTVGAPNCSVIVSGETSQANSAVPPFGSRIQLKSGSDCDVIQIYPQMLLTPNRVTLRGLYIDGNRDNNAAGHGIYVGTEEAGIRWGNVVIEHCVVARASEHGIYLDSVSQAMIENVSVQSCDGNGIYGYASWDDTLRHVFCIKNELAGINLTYCGNTRAFAIDCAYNVGNGLTLKDNRNSVWTTCSIDHNGGNGVEIIGSSDAYDGFVSGTAYVSMQGGKFYFNNNPSPGESGTNPAADGTYSNLKFSGDGVTHFGHRFSNIELQYGGENTAVKRPKYGIEDTRTGVYYNGKPGYQLYFVNCVVADDNFTPSYWQTARWSAGMTNYATMWGISEHSQESVDVAHIGSIVVDDLQLGGARGTNFVAYGFGATTPFRIVRTNIVSLGMYLSGTETDPQWFLRDSTNSVDQLSIVNSGGTARTLRIGGNSYDSSDLPRSVSITGDYFSGGHATDAPAKQMTLFPSLGTGAGSITDGYFEFYTPTANASGTTVHGASSALKVTPYVIQANRPLLIKTNVSPGAVANYIELWPQTNTATATMDLVLLKETGAAKVLWGAELADTPTAGQVQKYNADGTVTWEDPGGASADTASNLGSGARPFSSKVAADFQFRTLTNADASITVVEDGNLIKFTATGSDSTAIHDNVAGEIAAVTQKNTPAAADMILIEDSADSNNKKMIEIGDLPAGGGASTLDTVGDPATDKRFEMFDDPDTYGVMFSGNGFVAGLKANGYTHNALVTFEDIGNYDAQAVVKIAQYSGTPVNDPSYVLWVESDDSHTVPAYFAAGSATVDAVFSKAISVNGVVFDGSPTTLSQTVLGPGVATAQYALPTWSDTTGTNLVASPVLVSPAGNVTGVNDLSMAGTLTASQFNTGILIVTNSVASPTNTTAHFIATNTMRIPNSASDFTMANAGEMTFNTTDEQINFHSAADGEISGEASLSLIQTQSWTFDPKVVCDGAVDRFFLMWIGKEAPEGIIIDQWKLSFEADPTTELDADLKYADAMIGVAGAATVDALDTTSGYATEDTDANINGGAAIATGKALYIEFVTPYTETTHQIMFQIWYHAEED